MNLRFSAPTGSPAYSIDAIELNNDLCTALGGWCNGWNAFHSSTEAIIDLSPEREKDAKLVEQVVMAHVASTELREKQAGVKADIAKLEATVTPRMLREAVLGKSDGVKVVDDQIATLREKL